MSFPQGNRHLQSQRDLDTGADIWGVVYAAGSGRRFGGYKQFEKIGDEPLVHRCVRVLRSICQGIVVVLPADHHWSGPPVEHAVPGGATNPESVRAGVNAVPSSAAYIVMHSPSHPLASVRLARSVLDRARDDVDGACPVSPIHDVIKRIGDDQIIVGTVPKVGLAITQMPMAFRAAVVRRALAIDVEGSDVQTIVERHGGRIAAVPGEPTNLHVTTRDELEMARHLATLVSD